MKTAVEHIEEQMLYKQLDYQEFAMLILEAKKMEKQQIIDAYKEGCFDSILDESTDKVRSEQYYNETFKSK